MAKAYPLDWLKMKSLYSRVVDEGTVLYSLAREPSHVWGQSSAVVDLALRCASQMVASAPEVKSEEITW